MEINIKTFARAMALIIGLITVVSSRSTAQDLSSKVRVAQSPMWKRLLHFRYGFLTGVEATEIDDPDFFLSPRGGKDSLAELEATLKAFAEPAAYRIGRYQQHPQCVYPARYQFLKRELGFTHPEIECTEFKKWKTGLAIQSVSLVYAAPYLGNPASMFGHTFLRLNSSSRLLQDAGLSFDALPTEDGSLAFVWKGLTGGYRGVFSQQPYYAKIKTYGQIENRDLWEYDLNLSSEQIDRLIDHIWEVGSTYLDYYFFDENCSYQLMSLLEVANADWNLRDHFTIKTVPLDTVRALDHHKNSIRSVQKRPALRAKLEQNLARLSSAQRNLFWDAVRGRDVELTDAEVRTLDALLDWIEFQKANRFEGGARFSSGLEDRVLIARAKAGPSASGTNFDSTLKMAREEGPDRSHRSSKASVGFFRDTYFSGWTFGVRAALHDRLESDLGYVPFSTLVLGDLQFSYLHEARRASFEALTLAKVENFRPMTSLQKRPSWVAGLQVERPRDLGCSDCVAAQATIGFGASQGFSQDRMLATLLVKMRTEYSNSFNDEYGQSVRFRPSVDGLVQYRVSDSLKLEAELEQGWTMSRQDRAVVAAWTLAGSTALALNRQTEFRLTADVAKKMESPEASGFRATLGYFF